MKRLNWKNIILLPIIAYWLSCDGTRVLNLGPDCDSTIKTYDDNHGILVFDNQEMYYAFATCLYNVNRYDEAEGLLKQSFTQGEDHANSFILMGRIHSYKGFYEKAITFYTKALKIKRDTRTYTNRGMNYERMNKFDSAIFDFTSAIELDASNAYAFNNRGRVYVKLLEFDKARTDLKDSELLDDSNPYLFKNKGLLELTIGDTVKACNLFRKAQNIGFESFKDPKVKQEVAQMITLHCQ